MRSLADIPVATCVLRTELLLLRQECDESFRAFAARVRGKAETCAYTVKTKCSGCGADGTADDTDSIIRDVLLNGISDPDIRRETLGTRNILSIDVNDVVALVEGKETARNTVPSPGLSAVSSLQRLRAFLACGFSRDDMYPVHLSMKSALHFSLGSLQPPVAVGLHRVGQWCM